MKRIINCETGEVIDREFNDEELTQLEADIAASEAIENAKEADAAAKAETKAELLAKLGITAEEAALLLS
jgi:leucyl aminopeptidase (aminopeptidase T)